MDPCRSSLDAEFAHKFTKGLFGGPLLFVLALLGTNLRRPNSDSRFAEWDKNGWQDTTWRSLER